MRTVNVCDAQARLLGAPFLLPWSEVYTQHVWMQLGQGPLGSEPLMNNFSAYEEQPDPSCRVLRNSALMVSSVLLMRYVSLLSRAGGFMCIHGGSNNGNHHIHAEKTLAYLCDGHVHE